MDFHRSRRLGGSERLSEGSLTVFDSLTLLPIATPPSETAILNFYLHPGAAFSSSFGEKIQVTNEKICRKNLLVLSISGILVMGISSIFVPQFRGLVYHQSVNPTILH